MGADVASLNLGRSLVNIRPVTGPDCRGLPEHAAPGDSRVRDLVDVRAAAGVVAAVRQNSRFDAIITGFNSLGLAIPAFWLGLMLILVFAVQLQWLPPSGVGNPGQPGT